MITGLAGTIHSLTPNKAEVLAGGVIYEVNISLQTYTHFDEVMKRQPEYELPWKHLMFIHHLQREGFQALYGFSIDFEREVFRHLLSVSGVGPGTALAALSHYKANDLASIIASGEKSLLRKIKGIGEKAAQQIIMDLQKKFAETAEPVSLPVGINTDALEALVSLGFSKTDAKKALEKVDPALSVEAQVRTALSFLSR